MAEEWVNISAEQMKVVRACWAREEAEANRLALAARCFMAVAFCLSVLGLVCWLR
jgi:hypothetical protein